MKTRTAKRIYYRWLFLRDSSRPPWKKSTLDLALEIWLCRRFFPDNFGLQAW